MPYQKSTVLALPAVWSSLWGRQLGYRWKGDSISLKGDKLVTRALLIKINGMSVTGKKRGVVECVKKEQIDVARGQETGMIASGMIHCMNGYETEV